MAHSRPNLMFLMTDHQRADSLGMVQAGVEVAPNLNRLASESVVFERAYSTCPLCVPARTALFTGTYPTRNGVVINDWAGESAGDYVPLQQCLAEAGYEVAHVGVDHIRLKPPLRDRVPFSLWVDRSDHAAYLKRQRLAARRTAGTGEFTTEVVEQRDGKEVRQRYSSARTAVWPHAAEHFMDSYWARRGEEFLRQPRGEPFALFLFLWAPHPPLVVPEPYASLFDPEKIDLPPNVGLTAEGEPPGRRRGVAGQLGEGVSMDQWRRAWAAHLGLVNMADACLGGVLRALADSGQADDTVIVFTVDHGDHLGQHRMYQKMDMYDQAVRVPLVLRVPGCAPASFATPVSHLDVMPTLLSLMDLAEPGGLDGLSLRESIVSGTGPPDRPVFCQYSGTLAVNDIRRSVIVGRHKYTHDPAGVADLYDLESDPLEMTNLAPDPAYADVVEELHQLCRSWHESHGDWVEF